MFKVLRFSIKKSRILSKIRKLKQNERFKPEDLLNSTINRLAHGNTLSKEDLLMEELLNLLSKDESTLKLLEKHGKTFEDIRGIISCLKSNGAGQIVNGHYVAVSSIAFIDSLDFLLSYWSKDGFDIEDFDRKNSNMMVAARMLDSF